MKQLALQEAKEYADHLHKQIHRAREKGWQLMLFILIIDVYLVKNILEVQNSAVYLWLFTISAPYTIYIFRKMRVVVFPVSYISPGARVATLRAEMKNAKAPDRLVDALMDSVDLQVKANRTVHQEMIDAYKKGMWAFIAMLGVMTLIVLVSAIVDIIIKSL